ncbi:MAG: hypothetical protein RL477_750 [Pseudomonadota bacterium]|jgi:SAM-dependent methyltransferase
MIRIRNSAPRLPAGVSTFREKPLAVDTDTRCLLCGGPTAGVLSAVFDNRFGAPGTCAIVRCADCEQLQTAPRLTEAELAGTYETYYNYGSGATAYARFRERLVRSWLYRLWLAIDGDITFQTVKGAGRLLDVGCNEGRGLEQFRRNGFDAEGQEINHKAADMARARGFAVATEPLSRLRADHAFDVVVLSNVLEHASDPRAMLTDVARLLRRGGEVWITLPNARSVWRGVFGRQWINWHVPYHITHFDIGTLGRLLGQSGFAVATARNETPALWIAQSVIAALFARPGRPCRQMRSIFIVAPLIAAVRLLMFPVLWWFNRRGRGDALVVHARKA